jgi:hypothetical protein
MLPRAIVGRAHTRERVGNLQSATLMPRRDTLPDYPRGPRSATWCPLDSRTWDSHAPEWAVDTP